MTPLTHQRVAVFYNPDKKQARKAYRALVAWLKARKVPVLSNINDPRVSSAQFAVILGGDGTIIGAARLLAKPRVPILGVNLGHLGFLAATEFNNLYKVVEKALKGKFQAQERSILRVNVLAASGKTVFSSLAVNDCYLHADTRSRIVAVETRLNGEFLTVFKGDGVIVATPTGSTAYSLAAGGPIVSPELPVMVLTPISPHTLSQRPLVVSEKSKMELVIGKASSPMLFSVDGQINRVVKPGMRIIVEGAKEKIRVLVNPERTYFEILRTKLRWGS